MGIILTYFIVIGQAHKCTNHATIDFIMTSNVNLWWSIQHNCMACHNHFLYFSSASTERHGMGPRSCHLPL